MANEMRVLSPGEFGTGRAKRDMRELSEEMFEAGARVGDDQESFIDPEEDVERRKRSSKRPNRHRPFDLYRDGDE